MTWLRKHAWALLTGFSALLTGVVVWGSLRRQNASLRAAVRAEAAKTKAAGHAALRDDAVRREKELDQVDAAIEQKIKAAEKSIEKTTKKAQELSDEEVVRRLNEMYRREHRR